MRARRGQRALHGATRGIGLVGSWSGSHVLVVCAALGSVVIGCSTPRSDRLGPHEEPDAVAGDVTPGETGDTNLSGDAVESPTDVGSPETSVPADTETAQPDTPAPLDDTDDAGDGFSGEPDAESAPEEDASDPGDVAAPPADVPVDPPSDVDVAVDPPDVAPPQPTCIETAKTGYYCGGDKVDYADPGTLYRCQGPGPAEVVEVCLTTCLVAPPGQDDACEGAPEAVCTATAGTGKYCGGSAVEDGDPNTLYHCNGPGPAAVEKHCESGCLSKSGQDDVCAAAQSPVCDATAVTGYYCEGDKVSGGSVETLYLCHGPGPAAVVELCASGCVVAPPGQDDYCAPTAVPTCIATAKTGDYCGGDKVDFAESGTLYWCSGPGPATVKKDCAAGCVVAPAGQDDYCAVPPAATCSSTAKTGDYCGGDKVTSGDADTLYACTGPGPATVVSVCAAGCVVAPTGQDDYCASVGPDCPHEPLLKWGLAPAASDHLRCAGITASKISQTIGNATASAGTHKQDGTIDGKPYCAATDLSVKGLTDAQVKVLVGKLTDQGFVAFFRNPGHDGWPAYEARHIHAIYAGVPMKASLRSQVTDWTAGLNGLASQGPYTFFKPTAEQKALIESLFDAAN